MRSVSSPDSAKLSNISAQDKPPQVAEPPFDDEEANIVLVSSDNVLFHVQRVILALASPFFKSMFSLNQPPVVEGEAVIQPEQSDPIPVPEDCLVLDSLLRFCYPVRDPVITDITFLGEVLEAAMKYEMDQATFVLRQLIADEIPESALHVFAVVCRLELEDDARQAAEAYRQQQEPFLKPRSWVAGNTEWGLPGFQETVPGHIYNDVLDVISAGTYFRLLQFLRTGEATTFCTPHVEGASKVGVSSRTFPDFSQSGADLELKTTDGQSFLCHRVVLTLASAQRLLTKGTSPTISSESIPVYHVDLNSSILNDVLVACYPPSEKSVNISRDAFPLHILPAARRLKITPILTLAKHFWPQIVSRDPLSAYCTAIGLGWDEQAQQAARGTVETDRDIVHAYVADMEHMPANAYQQLLRYHHRCYRAALEQVTTVTGKNYSQCQSLQQNPAAISATSSILLPMAELCPPGNYNNYVAFNERFKTSLEAAFAGVCKLRITS